MFGLFSTPIKIRTPSRISRPGHYILANDLAVESGTAIRIECSDVTIDLNQKTISCTGPSTKRKPTFGILAVSAEQLVVMNGALTGFRFGIHSTARETLVHRTDLSGNTYCGCHLSGDHSVFRNNLVRNIGGVDDEIYAVGVNLTSGQMTVENNYFQNIYRQQSAPADGQGEGCAIIINRDAKTSRVDRNYITNDEARPGTIGIFVGDGAHHILTHNTLCRFRWGIANDRDAGGSVSIEDNNILLDISLPGSRGISAFRGLVRANCVVGYETPISGDTERRDNRIGDLRAG